MKLKSKLALGLGSMTAIVAPIATVVACENRNKGENQAGENAPVQIVNGRFVAPTSYKIPDGTTTINGYRYYGNDFPVGFSIPSSVTRIGNGTFRNATFKDGFTIPETVKEIDWEAFAGATLPAGFAIPSSAIVKGGFFEWAFKEVKLPIGYMWSKLDSNGRPTAGSQVVPVHIDPNATSIDGGAFEGVILPAGFTFPQGVTSMGADAFARATLPAGFTIPSHFEDMFEDTKLPTGYMWSKLDSNGHLVAGSSVVPVHIDPNATSIGEHAFKHAALPAGFTVPQGVTSIEGGAFEGAILPAGFTIPSSVTSIAGSAFLYSSLPTGYMWSKGSDLHPVAGSSVVARSSVVHVHVDPNATSIEEYAFYGATLPTGFTIPSSVTEIKQNAFAGATLPEGFTIPSSVKVANRAFEGAIFPKDFVVVNRLEEGYHGIIVQPGFTTQIENFYYYSKISVYAAVTIPLGYKWSNVDAQGDPIKGASIVKE